MKEYTVNAEIRLDKARSVEFEKSFKISFQSQGIKSAKISSISWEKMTVKSVIFAEDDQEAEARATLHSNFLANRIAFHLNIPIRGLSITGMSCQETNGSKSVISMRDIMFAVDSLGIKLKLSEGKITKLNEFLERQLQEKTEEYLTMYRIAVSEKSIAMRYFLLYSLMEKILGGQNGVESWIRAQELNVRMEKDPRNNTPETIYTYLRNHIHARTIEFPYKEISRYVHKLQDLARKAVEQKI